MVDLFSAFLVKWPFSLLKISYAAKQYLNIHAHCNGSILIFNSEFSYLSNAGLIIIFCMTLDAILCLAIFRTQEVVSAYGDPDGPCHDHET